MSSLSETEKSDPDPSSIGEFTKELSEAGDSIHDEINTFTRVVANIASRTHDSKNLAHEELTQKYHKKYTKLRKDFGEALSDLRLLIKILLFCASIGVLCLSFGHYERLASNLVEEYASIQTCIFEWSEWSQCDLDCSTPTKNATRSRRVIPETVIDMRHLQKDSGIFHIWIYVMKFLHSSKCYEIQQTSLCNLYECPVDITSLTEFTPCQYNMLADNPKDEQCIKYRKLPTRGIVRIDTPKDMYEKCPCYEAHYPF